MRLGAFRKRDGPCNYPNTSAFSFGMSLHGKEASPGEAAKVGGQCTGSNEPRPVGYPRPPTQAHCPKNQPDLLSLKTIYLQTLIQQRFVGDWEETAPEWMWTPSQGRGAGVAQLARVTAQGHSSG